MSSFFTDDTNADLSLGDGGDASVPEVGAPQESPAPGGSLPAINLVVSNVPGATKKMYFRGAEVTEVYPVNTLPPAVALSITACSYAGGLYIGLVGGRTALPAFTRLKELIDEAYEEFRERVTGI